MADDTGMTKAEIKEQIRQELAAAQSEQAINQIAAKFADIMSDNQKYRHERKQQPTVNDQDLADLEAYRKFGDVATIKASLEEAQAHKARIEAIDREAALTRIASHAGIQNHAAFVKLFGDQTFETVQIPDATGALTNQVMVVHGTQKTPFRQYVQANEAWALPLLFPEQQSPNPNPQPNQPHGGGSALSVLTTANSPKDANGGVNADDLVKLLNDQRNAK